MKKAYLVTLYNIYDASTEVKKVIATSEQKIYMNEREYTNPGQHIQSIKKFLELVIVYADAA
jgi:hypothetical protein